VQLAIFVECLTNKYSLLLTLSEAQHSLNEAGQSLMLPPSEKINASLIFHSKRNILIYIIIFSQLYWVTDWHLTLTMAQWHWLLKLTLILTMIPTLTPTMALTLPIGTENDSSSRY
jgi:hypothetical protein